MEVIDMTNIEKYINDILKTNNCDFAFDIEKNEIIECDCSRCQKCLFSCINREEKSPTCNVARTKWLAKQYKGVE